MLEKSFGLFFYLKQSKNQKKEERYIYLRITVNGVSKEITTRRLWSTRRWSQATGRALGTREDSRQLNNFLDAYSSQVHEAKLKLIEDRKTVTAQAIKDVLMGVGEKTYNIIEVFDQHNAQMKALIGQDFAPATLTRYKTARDHAANFIRWKYGVTDLTITELDYEFVEQFAYWLKTERKCSGNSTAKYISNLKKIVLDCIKKGWLVHDPFANFHTTRKEVIRVALTAGEIKAIAEKVFDCDRLDHVRDIFLFSCYTGLAYIDAYQLKRSDIVIGVDGDKWINTTRQKTDSPTRLPLLPGALLIIEKYKDNPKCVLRDKVLPVLTNQKMNSYLKEIQDHCNIKKNLTFHIARHTFATTVTLSNGVPMETVSKMLGHRSIKQTQHYAKIVDVKISEDMATLKNKLRNL